MSINWHIITASKGGIGKTLLSLLLLAYKAQKQNTSTLIIDLNATNTDSAALLLYSRNRGKVYELNLIEKIPELGAEKLIIRKSSTETNNEPDYFCVGQLDNPFVLCTPFLFAKLLSIIKESAEEITNSLDMPLLQDVIIDTNYHFCNLFGSHKKQYASYIDGVLKNDCFNIFFLWVYRQLDKLLNNRESKEVEIIESTAVAIESYLTGSRCQVNNENFTKNDTTRLLHVFSPISLLSSQQTTKDKRNTLHRFAKTLHDIMWEPKKDVVITELEKIGKLQNENTCINFEIFVNKLDHAKTRVEHRYNKQDPHLIIIDTLEEFINGLKDYPMNIIPIWAYIASLQYYTDKNNIDIISTIRNMDKLYKDNFLKLWEK
ncbi:MAG: hypothetical protein VSS75_020190 [Candidatus Parabeggiatoa sp.]|nr:hypothetical protein [Candidatus Parabeggiatoa sp.]